MVAQLQSLIAVNPVESRSSLCASSRESLPFGFSSRGLMPFSPAIGCFMAVLPLEFESRKGISFVVRNRSKSGTLRIALRFKGCAQNLVPVGHQTMPRLLMEWHEITGIDSEQSMSTYQDASASLASTSP